MLCVKDSRERGNVDDEGPEIDSGMEYKKDAQGKVTPAARTRADLKAEPRPRLRPVPVTAIPRRP